MTNSPILGIPYIEEGQENKEEDHRSGVQRLEAVSPLVVIDKDLGSTPATPSEGDRYIVSTGASTAGAWDGQDENVAIFYDSTGTATWKFLTPVEGWAAYVQDEDEFYLYTIAGWTLGLGNLEHIVGSYFNGNSTAGGDIYFRYITPRAYTIPNLFSGSRAYSGTLAATTDATVNIRKSGVTIGSVKFSSTNEIGVFSQASTGMKSFSIGDVLELTAPSPTDANLGDISITFKGTRT